MALEETNIGKSTIGGNPTRALSLQIADNSVSTPKIQDLAVTTAKINYKAVTPDRLSDSVVLQVIAPLVDAAKEVLSTSIRNLANKEERDILDVQDDYNTKINNLRTTHNTDINTLRNDYTNKYNTLNSKINNTASAITNGFTEQLNSLDTKHTKNYSNLQKQITDNQRVYSKNRSEDLKMLQTKDKDLQNQIKSLIAGSSVPISTEFGDDDLLVISQSTITRAINKLWQKLEDMTGEVLQGISMSVTPDYFISEDGCNVHIKANTVETNGIFEHIAFYINGTLLTEASNVDYFEYDTAINETSVIKCTAKIMGVEYTREKLVTHYNSFWLGAGNSYSDIMNVEHVIPITNGMRGAYDVNVAQGQHIIIIVGESLAGGFLRADLNSVEIPFTESTVTVDGKNYKVFTSENVYNVGSYNIDVNG